MRSGEAARHFRKSRVSALDRDGQSGRGYPRTADGEPLQRRDPDRHAAHGALELELRGPGEAAARMVSLRTRVRRRAAVSVDDRGDHPYRPGRAALSRRRHDRYTRHSRLHAGGYSVLARDSAPRPD